jgi:1,4-alpha-glucan branching enzyme
MHSWGYNPSDPFAVEQAYGGPDGLKTWCRKCHRRGLAVHLDIVHNHYGPENLDLLKFDGSGAATPWAASIFTTRRKSA